MWSKSDRGVTLQSVPEPLAASLVAARRELLRPPDGLLNANLARVTVRQNVTIQQVSASAAIAAAATIITGIDGMNLRHMPELGWIFGYPLAIAIIALTIVVLRWYLKRLGLLWPRSPNSPDRSAYVLGGGASLGAIQVGMLQACQSTTSSRAPPSAPSTAPPSPATPHVRQSVGARRPPASSWSAPACAALIGEFLHP